MTLIRTTLTFESEAECKKVADLMKSDKSPFDFENLIPYPKSKEECPEEFLLLESEPIQPDSERPWFSWYRWRKAFWGCHKNAKNVEVGEKVISFDTEDLPPVCVLARLKDMCPAMQSSQEI